MNTSIFIFRIIIKICAIASDTQLALANKRGPTEDYEIIVIVNAHNVQCYSV